MFIRVLALLFALGLFISSVETVDARDLGTPPTAELIDQVDDAADIALVQPPTLPLDETLPLAPIMTSDSPPRFSPCSFVFRPPRAYAFN
ncbi:MAG TPA: hypothetical protein VIV40_35195 [Kofleriaceae bacterium]